MFYHVTDSFYTTFVKLYIPIFSGEYSRYISARWIDCGTVVLYVSFKGILNSKCSQITEVHCYVIVIGKFDHTYTPAPLIRRCHTCIVLL